MRTSAYWVKLRIMEELGFPGAGHLSLLRSRGERGRRKVGESYSGRIGEVKGKFPVHGTLSESLEPRAESRDGDVK